jgi:hypothetical protein
MLTWINIRKRPQVAVTNRNFMTPAAIAVPRPDPVEVLDIGDENEKATRELGRMAFRVNCQS